MKKSAHELCENVRKGALKDVFETLAEKEKPTKKGEEPKWPSVKISK